jgi:hypothetical protein
MTARAALVLIAVVTAPALARAQAYTASYQTWASATIQGNVHPDVQLCVDLNARFYDDFHPYQMLVRPAVGVRLTEGMYAWLGYGWTPSWTASRGYVDEHRAWEQWTYDVPGLGAGLRVFLRTRLEQRARPSIGSDVALRLRQFARILIPFAPGFPLHLSLWDEAFVALTDSGDSTGRLWQRIGFDQNRLFGGIGWTIDPSWRIEAGYLNHWIVRANAVDEVHHVAMVNVFVTIR